MRSSTSPACSGLAGTGDVAELERSSDRRPRLALEVFAHRIAGAVAAMATALDGLDALVFTAGIGEHSRSSCANWFAAGSGSSASTSIARRTRPPSPMPSSLGPEPPCASSPSAPARSS